MTGRPQPSRVLIVGQSKTGTTGLFYALRRALPAPLAEYFETPPERIDLTAPALLAKQLFEATAPPAAGFLARFDRVFALQRDPRDRLISQFLFRSTRLDYLRDEAQAEAFLALLRRKEADPAALDLLEMIAVGVTAGRPEFVDAGIHQALAYAAWLEGHGEALHRLRYEDMVAGRLRPLAAALGVGEVRLVEPAAPFRHVLRSGGSGAWRRWLTGRDVDRLRPALSPALAALGYPADDWELDSGPLDPAEGSGYASDLIASRRSRRRGAG
jgi:hypothetical protein